MDSAYQGHVDKIRTGVIETLAPLSMDVEDMQSLLATQEGMDVPLADVSAAISREGVRHDQAALDAKVARLNLAGSLESIRRVTVEIAMMLQESKDGFLVLVRDVFCRINVLFDTAGIFPVEIFRSPCEATAPLEPV